MLRVKKKNPVFYEIFTLFSQIKCLEVPIKLAIQLLENKTKLILN